jgi:shikimate kinase
VKRVLLTGLSGTGKSTVTAALAAQGHRAVDLDTADYSNWVDAADWSEAPGTPVEPGRDWVWQEDRVRELLADERGDVLFASGCAPNMNAFLPRFDHVVLLSAPAEVLVERLQARTGDAYGTRPGQVERVVGLVETVEPLLRQAASHEIDTTVPLEEVVARILEIARRPAT